MSHWLHPDWPKTVALIQRETKDDQGRQFLTPIGSGTFLIWKDVSCILTCKHVADIGTWIAINRKPSGIMVVPISDYQQRTGLKWFFHHDVNVDLAAMPFPIQDTMDIKFIWRDLFESPEGVVEGDDVFFLGFPLGIGSREKLTPLVRAGIVSYKQNDSILLIEGNVFPGNSGGPVFLKPSFYDFKTGTFGRITPPTFIGLLQAFISYEEVAVSLQTGRQRVVFQENSGLARVYSTKPVTEMLESPDFLKAISELPKTPIVFKPKERPPPMRQVTL